MALTDVNKLTSHKGITEKFSQRTQTAQNEGSNVYNFLHCSIRSQGGI